MEQVKLSQKGHKLLMEEFLFLSKEERPKIVKNVSNAALEGDRSENAEYIYGKKRLREIDRRLMYLSKLLKNPRVVNSKMVDISKISFGTKVRLQDENGNIKSWTIVGNGEANFKDGSISIDSPVAKALLGNKKGDIVSFELNKNLKEFEILNIEVGDID